jgi:signal transduction histidine kinase
MTHTPPTPAGDPGVFADRLLAYRRRLFEGLVWARLVIVAAIGAIMPAERGHGRTSFHLELAEWLLLAAWSVAGAVYRRRLFDLVDARPRLAWVEMGLFVQAVLIGGGWRTPFDIYSWPAMGVTSVFLAPAAALTAAGVACAAFLLGTVGSVARGDPLAAHVSARELVGGLLGYGVVGAAFWCVRLRIDELAEAAAGYRVQAQAAREAERRASAARERTEMAFALHTRLRQAFPAIGLRLGLMRELAAGDPVAERSLAALGEAVRDADLRLDELVAELEVADPGPAQRSTSGSSR